MKTKIITSIIVLFISVAVFLGFSSNTPPLVMNIIDDNAVTSTNDTLFSDWVNVDRFSDVEIFVVTGDSISFNGGFVIQYKAGGDYFGSATPYSSDTALISNLATATPKASGKVLRSGSVSSIIPGATQVRARLIRQTYSTAVLSSARVVLVAR